MCTISWLSDGRNLHVRFNRDESLSRPRALPPAIFSGNPLPFAAPRDPIGGGTWIAASAAGTVFALLNHYESSISAAPATASRGALPWSLAAGSRHLDDTLGNPPTLARLAPFHLFVLRSGFAARHSWDGASLGSHPLDPAAGFLTTSSWNAGEVVALRTRAFERLQRSGSLTSAGLDRLHDGLETPHDPASGILMDRPGRRTLSQTQIRLGREALTLDYRERDPAGQGFLPPRQQIRLPVQLSGRTPPSPWPSPV